MGRGRRGEANSQTSVNFSDFAELCVVSFQQITFKVGIFTNFKSFFLVIWKEFR